MVAVSIVDGPELVFSEIGIRIQGLDAAELADLVLYQPGEMAGWPVLGRGDTVPEPEVDVGRSAGHRKQRVNLIV